MAKQENPKPAQSAAPSGNGKPERARLTAGASSHHDMAAATALAANALSRERYELMIKVIFGMIAVIAIQMVSIVYLATRPVEQRYFTTDPQGNIRPLTALSKPMPATDQVLNWTAMAVTRGYTLSFARYKQQFDEVRSNFTSDGWVSFEDAVTRAGLIETLVKSQLVSTAVIREAPVIVAQGLVGDAYGWRIQVPISVTFQSANVRESRQSMIEVTVVRVPETQNPAGLGIAQLISK